MPKNTQPTREDYAPYYPPPPPSLPVPEGSAGRAVVVVIPSGPYSPQEYAEMARTIAREFAHWPTPAPQLTAALAAAVLQWARAQQPD